MFYTFNQNNSGGSFITNDRVAKYVIIEADSNKEADKKAEELGIYFNGCALGFDCDCCGDRWYESYGNGDNAPKIYDKPVKEYQDTWFTKVGETYAYVHNKDGTVDTYKRTK